MPMTQADVRDCIAPELKEFGMRRVVSGGGCTITGSEEWSMCLVG